MNATEQINNFVRLNGGNERDALNVALTRLDLANAHAARLMQQRDEARRQLSEAQTAIDAMAQIVGAADEVKHQLEQARSDIEDYRAEIARLTRKAMTA